MCRHKKADFVHNYAGDARDLGFDHPYRSVWLCKSECGKYFGMDKHVEGGYTVDVAPQERSGIL